MTRLVVAIAIIALAVIGLAAGVTTTLVPTSQPAQAADGPG